MIDGMIQNFKKAVGRANEKSFSLNNNTSIRPINLVAGSAGGQQRVSIQDLQIEGLNNPKVFNVYVNSKNMKLHVVFNYKLIKVYGKCYSTSSSAPTSKQLNSNKVQQLLEATNWNTSWSASLMPMIGRDHFDMNKVYTSHGQQRLSLNLKECPQNVHDKLKIALLDRIKQQIETRLTEVMESVMMQTDSQSEDFLSPSTTTESSLLLAPKIKVSRGKRASPTLTTGPGKAAKQAAKPTSAPKKAPAAASSTKKPADQPVVVAKKSKEQTPKRKNDIERTPRKANPITSPAPPAKKATSTPVVTKKPVVRDTKVKSSTTTTTTTTSKPKAKAAAAKVTSPAKKQPAKQQQKALKRTKRQTPCQQGEELDDYVDQLFRFGTRIVRAMEPITTPNATIELPDYNLKIFLYDGKGTRAYKFRRAKSAWVFCSNETISLGLTIEVEELRVAYKYRVISGSRLLFDGDLEAKLSPKVQAQFSQKVQEEDSEEPVQQRVDRVRVFRLGKVHVIIRGLGNLTQSLSMIINSYLNDNQEELQPTFRMVEGDAVRLINRLLANVNVPLLSVV